MPALCKPAVWLCAPFVVCACWLAPQSRTPLPLPLALHPTTTIPFLSVKTTQYCTHLCNALLAILGQAAYELADDPQGLCIILAPSSGR